MTNDPEELANIAARERNAARQTTTKVVATIKPITLSTEVAATGTASGTANSSEKVEGKIWPWQK